MHVSLYLLTVYDSQSAVVYTYFGKISNIFDDLNNIIINSDMNAFQICVSRNRSCFLIEISLFYITKVFWHSVLTSSMLQFKKNSFLGKRCVWLHGFRHLWERVKVSSQGSQHGSDALALSSCLFSFLALQKWKETTRRRWLIRPVYFHYVLVRGNFCSLQNSKKNYSRNPARWVEALSGTFYCCKNLATWILDSVRMWCRIQL